MSGSRLVTGLLLVVLVGTGAKAADAPEAGARVVYARPAPVEPGTTLQGAPYYVVNQGPIYSGPGITAYPAGYLDTDVQRHYPSIGMTLPDQGEQSFGLDRWSRNPLVGSAEEISLARAQALPSAAPATGQPAAMPKIFHARAELKMLGPDRIDIKLYRDSAPHAEQSPHPQTQATPEQRRRLLNKALELQKERTARQRYRNPRAYRAGAGDRGHWHGSAARARENWLFRLFQQGRVNDYNYAVPRGWSGYGVVPGTRSDIQR